MEEHFDIYDGQEADSVKSMEQRFMLMYPS